MVMNKKGLLKTLEGMVEAEIYFFFIIVGVTIPLWVPWVLAQESYDYLNKKYFKK